MYAERLGYLHAPEKEGGISRMALLQKRDMDLGLPECPPHLIQWMNGLGWHSVGFSSIIPLSSSEVSAWVNGTGSMVEKYEFQWLLDASRHYVAGYYKKDDAQGKPVSDLSGFFSGLNKK